MVTTDSEDNVCVIIKLQWSLVQAVTGGSGVNGLK